MNRKSAIAGSVLALAALLALVPSVTAATRPWPVRALSSDHITGFTANHELASDGSHLYLVNAHEATALRGDLVFRRSDDGGLTWTDPMTLFSTGSTFTELAGNLAIVATDARVVVAFRAHTASDAYLFTMASRDGGETWSHRVRIARVTTSLRMGIPSLAMTSAGVMVAWTDRTNGRIFTRLSTDAGASYGAPQRIATTTFTFACGNPDYTDGFVTLAAGGEDAYVAWTFDPSSTCSTPTEALRRSTDGGRSWKPRQTLPGSEGTYGWPEIAVQGNRAAVLLNMVAPHALLLVTSNAGATFSKHRIAALDATDFVTSGDVEYAPDGAIWVVLGEYLTAPAGGFTTWSTILARRSTDGGATWAPPSTVAFTNNGEVESSPNLCFAAGRTVVAYTRSAYDGSTNDLFAASLGSLRAP